MRECCKRSAQQIADAGGKPGTRAACIYCVDGTVVIPFPDIQPDGSLNQTVEDARARAYNIRQQCRGMNGR